MAEITFMPVINDKDSDVPQLDGQLIAEITSGKRGLYVDYQGQRYLLSAATGTTVTVGGNIVASLAFDSDPQTQIDGKTGITIAGEKVSVLNFDRDPNAELQEIQSKLYPVGCIAMFSNAFNPAATLGGTWTQLTDQFLIGAGGKYALGATGGEEMHQLTVDEMPRHNHNMAFGSVQAINGITVLNTQMASDQYGTSRDAIYSTGSGTPHNIMPPYLAVNIWRRDA